MVILWLLMALLMLSFVLLPLVRRRRGMIEQVHPDHPDAADPADYGFLRQEELDVRLPGPDQDLLDALELVQRTQDYRAAASLLAGTETAGELRWQRVQALGGAAALELEQRPGGVHETPGGQWLRVWRAERPEDAGGAAVHAEFLVQRAWRASATGTKDFRLLLEEAREVCGQAAELAPADPVPHIIELAVGRGLGLSRDEFERLWLKVLDRAPRGSLLAALPLFAVFEHLPEVNLVLGLYRSEVVAKAIQGAQHAAHEAGSADPTLPHVRHLLVFFLVRAERWAEAMQELIHVDGHVGALPWTLAADPAAEFAVYRALAVAGYEANGGSPASLPG